MTVDLNTFDAPPEIKQAASTAIAWITDHPVKDKPTCQLAADHRNGLKLMIAQAVELFEPIKKQAHDLHKAICARESLMATNKQGCPEPVTT